MAGWSVDPDRVVGVLSAIDGDGGNLTLAVAEADSLIWDGGPQLQADGRTTLSNAWNYFLENRRDVPGKLIHVISSSAEAVTAATTAVVSGDEQMSSSAREAEAFALEEWGIDEVWAYTN